MTTEDRLREFRRQVDELRQVSPEGAEYWKARDLSGALGYGAWARFREVISRAEQACESSGTPAESHFVQTGKMVTIGGGGEREVEDFFLSRYACYLTAMNGDPAKSEIAYAQTYFAVQARRQEIADQAAEIDRRVQLRERVRGANRKLMSAAKTAGVQKFGVFQSEGYVGLYGMQLPGIKARKGIPERDDLLDRAGRVELAANEFRITQTEDKLVRDRIAGERQAIETHRKVGEEVRGTIRRLGGTMPEDLPAEPPIKKVVAQRKKQIPKGGDSLDNRN